MTQLRLALRNLLRAPRRTLLTMSAVIAGVGVFILGEGFVSGLTENVIVAATDDTVGHVMARPAGYPLQLGRHPVDALLEIPPAARALLEREARAWTERTYFAPIAASGADSLRAVGIGYDPQRDAGVFSHKHWQVTGRLPDPAAREVTVSARVARLLSLSVGSSLVLQVRTHRGAMNALEVKVSGILATHNAGLDLFGIFAPRKLTRELLATDLPSHLHVRLASRAGAAAFAAKLRPLLGTQASVVTYVDETADLVAVQDIRRRALDIILVILMALAAFGIANTILMAAYERVREIGTLRTLGMTETGVLRLFVLEGALVGVVGSLLGAAWGVALTLHWAEHPIDFSKTMEQTGSNVSASVLLYTRPSLSIAVLSVVLGIAVALLASIFPARVASRMSPAEAVRAT
jgi:putative ABC transport system permease protein